MNEVIVGADPEAYWMMDGYYSYDGYSGVIPAGLVLKRLMKLGSDLVDTTEGFPAIHTDAGMLFADGISWELNPKPGSPKEVTSNLEKLLETTLDVGKILYTKEKRIDLHIQPSASIKLDMLPVWGDPQLAIFGCDPDKSIWPREIDPSNIDAANHRYRYFGGHIHIGFPDDDPQKFYADTKNIERIIVLADAFLGMLGLICDIPVSMCAHTRRKVYGQPGVYRIQPHGIEYRTISNSWLLNKTNTTAMLNVAAQLPALLETDVPDKLLRRGDIIRNHLIGGYLHPATRFVRSIDGYDKIEGIETILCSASARTHKGWRSNWRI